jgi:uncharacterized protein
VILDLREVIGVPGHSQSFDYSPDLSPTLDEAYISLTEPPRAYGSVRNDAGALSLQVTVDAQYLAVCARCLDEFPSELHFETNARLTESELAQDDPELCDLYYIGDGHLDLDEVIVTELILNALPNPICSETCRGLCPGCGANLNEGDCACKPELDPRLAALGQLLD